MWSIASKRCLSICTRQVDGVNTRSMHREVFVRTTSNKHLHRLRSLLRHLVRAVCVLVHEVLQRLLVPGAASVDLVDRALQADEQSK
jgi:hypothetical protein